MNERIRELAEQAKKNEPFECSYTKDQWLEKFAELIVQECAGRVDWILAYGGGTQGDLIREHFGVEP